MLPIANLKSIAIILVLLAILSAVIILATNQSTPQTPTQIPTQTIQPTSFPNLAPPSTPSSPTTANNEIEYSQEYLNQQERITQEEKPATDRALIVSNFIDKLPINGNNIRVTYNIYNNQIYLEYNKNTKEEALTEFVTVLKENQIQNINWLYNLNIVER